MAIADRLMGWDVGILALYVDTANPSDVNLSAPSYDLIGIYTDCRLRIEETERDGTATQELWENPLHLRAKWFIELNTVVDSNTATLTWTRLQSGAGPFWVQLVNGDGGNMYGRVRFNMHDLHLPSGPQNENTL